MCYFCPSVVDREEFLDFISPERLYLSALFFTVITTCFVIAIYRRLRLKKQAFVYRERINETLNEWIAEALVEDNWTPGEPNRWFKYVLARPDYRQVITDGLVTAKKNILGSAARNIITIYLHLGLKEDSLKKLASLWWYDKAQGIYELCIMEQSDALPDIYKHTNSNNEYVRMEAQTALVGFQGFGGLSFLFELTHTLNEWQQLRLLEQLTKLDPEEMPGLPMWLSSGNPYVRQFALKLAGVFNQYAVHDHVAECLNLPEEYLRYEAIKTLGRLSGDTTNTILTQAYPRETPGNKMQILRQLCETATETDLAFLLGPLTDADDSIKLEAARAIASCGSKGWNALNQAAHDNQVLTSIINQIKQERGV